MQRLSPNYSQSPPIYPHHLTIHQRLDDSFRNVSPGQLPQWTDGLVGLYMLVGPSVSGR